jgi:hypothetical protein
VTPTISITPSITPTKTVTPTVSITPTITPTSTPLPVLVYNFDVASLTGVPANGSSISGYTLTVNNAGSITYSSANSGYLTKTNSTGTDYIYGGPNYVTGQSYTVFMAYRLNATSSGRLLNTQNEASKDWLMGAYNGRANVFYPNFSINLNSGPIDTVWHLDWAVWDTNTASGSAYIATNTAPTKATYLGTNAGGGGFNQLRLFSRAAGTEVQTADIAFIKVYNGVLTIAQIQSLHASLVSRFY